MNAIERADQLLKTYDESKHPRNKIGWWRRVVGGSAEAARRSEEAKLRTRMGEDLQARMERQQRAQQQWEARYQTAQQKPGPQAQARPQPQPQSQQPPRYRGRQNVEAPEVQRARVLATELYRQRTNEKAAQQAGEKAAAIMELYLRATTSGEKIAAADALRRIGLDINDILMERGTRLLKEFQESQHPRDDHGRWADKEGGGGIGGEKPTVGEFTRKTAKKAIKETLSGAAWGLGGGAVGTIFAHKILQPAFERKYGSITNPTAYGGASTKITTQELLRMAGKAGLAQAKRGALWGAIFALIVNAPAAIRFAIDKIQEYRDQKNVAKADPKHLGEFILELNPAETQTFTNSLIDGLSDTQAKKMVSLIAELRNNNPVTKALLKAWDESKHPRDNIGRWTEAGSGGTAADTTTARKPGWLESAYNRITTAATTDIGGWSPLTYSALGAGPLGFLTSHNIKLLSTLLSGAASDDVQKAVGDQLKAAVKNTSALDTLTNVAKAVTGITLQVALSLAIQSTLGIATGAITGALSAFRAAVKLGGIPYLAALRGGLRAGRIMGGARAQLEAYKYPGLSRLSGVTPANRFEVRNRAIGYFSGPGSSKWPPPIRPKIPHGIGEELTSEQQRALEQSKKLAVAREKRIAARVARIQRDIQRRRQFRVITNPTKPPFGKAAPDEALTEQEAAAALEILPYLLSEKDAQAVLNILRPNSTVAKADRILKEWDESKHPRAEAGTAQGGQFTSGGETGTTTSTESKPAAKRTIKSELLRALAYGAAGWGTGLVGSVIAGAAAGSATPIGVGVIGAFVLARWLLNIGGLLAVIRALKIALRSEKAAAEGEVKKAISSAHDIATKLVALTPTQRKIFFRAFVDQLSDEQAQKLLDNLRSQDIGKKLGAGATVQDYIHDFVHSDNPRFKGKSKKERIQMALAAYYGRGKAAPIAKKLPAGATAADYIHDFVHSSNPRFKGKSKAERIRMALGAYYAHGKAAPVAKVFDSGHRWHEPKGTPEGGQFGSQEGGGAYRTTSTGAVFHSDILAEAAASAYGDREIPWDALSNEAKLSRMADIYLEMSNAAETASDPRKRQSAKDRAKNLKTLIDKWDHANTEQDAKRFMQDAFDLAGKWHDQQIEEGQVTPGHVPSQQPGQGQGQQQGKKKKLAQLLGGEQLQYQPLERMRPGWRQNIAGVAEKVSTVASNLKLILDAASIFVPGTSETASATIGSASTAIGAVASLSAALSAANRAKNANSTIAAVHNAQEAAQRLKTALPGIAEANPELKAKIQSKIDSATQQVSDIQTRLGSMFERPSMENITPESFRATGGRIVTPPQPSREQFRPKPYHNRVPPTFVDYGPMTGVGPGRVMVGGFERKTERTPRATEAWSRAYETGARIASGMKGQWVPDLKNPGKVRWEAFETGQFAKPGTARAAERARLRYAINYANRATGQAQSFPREPTHRMEAPPVRNPYAHLYTIGERKTQPGPEPAWARARHWTQQKWENWWRRHFG